MLDDMADNINEAQTPLWRMHSFLLLSRATAVSYPREFTRVQHTFL